MLETVISLIIVAKEVKGDRKVAEEERKQGGRGAAQRCIPRQRENVE